MSPKVEILSYFSTETDLAGEMRSWPEFVAGTGYDVELAAPDSEERVTVRYVTAGDDGSDYIEVRATVEGPLFDRVLGRVIYALAAHSDNLQVWRH